MTRDLHRTPRGLGRAGRALFRDVTGAYDLDPHELLSLTEACRLADLAADLEAVARDRGLTVQAVAEIRKCRQGIAAAVRDLAPVEGAGASDLARKLALRRTSTGRARMSRRKGEVEATDREALAQRLDRAERLFRYTLTSAAIYWQAGWKPPSGPSAPVVVDREDYWRRVLTGARNLASIRAALELPPKPALELPPDLSYLMTEEQAVEQPA